METTAPGTHLPVSPDRTGHTDHAPVPPSLVRRRILVRCLIATVGLLLCSTAPVLPALVPAYLHLVTEAEAHGAWIVLLTAEAARMAIAPLLALLLLVALARIERGRLGDYFGRCGTRVALGALTATSLAATAVAVLACGLTELSGIEQRSHPVMDGVSMPLLVVVGYGLTQAFVLQAIHEEWWFRGYAFRGHRGRPWFVLGATTVGFTLLHLFSSGGQQSVGEHLLYLAVPLGMGLWAGVERWCTNTVWSAVGIHGGIHAGVLASVLAGWSFGPASWVFLGAALCTAAVVRLLVSRPRGGSRSTTRAHGSWSSP